MSSPQPPISSASVRNILSLLAPRGAQLVAGTEGLHRRVTWASRMRARLPAFESVRGGELALLSLSQLRRLDETLPHLLDSLFKAGVAVAAVAAPSLESLDQEAISLANILRFPLLLLPAGAMLEEIEREVITFAVGFRGENERRATEISHRLIQLSAQGAGIQGVCEELARNCGKAVVVQDAEQKTLFVVSPAGSENVELPEPVSIESLSQQGLTRISMPILIRHEAVRSLSLVGQEGDFDYLDRLILGMVAPILAIEFVRERERSKVDGRSTTQRPEIPDMPSSVTYQKIRSPLRSVGAMAWSPDGKHLAVGNSSGELQTWTWSTENKNLLTSVYEEPEVLRTWSLGEKYAPSSGDTDLSEEWVQPAGPATMPSCALAWSPDSTRLAIAPSRIHYNRRFPIYLLDIATGDLLASYNDHHGYVYSIAWSPDGKFVASGDTDAKVHVWEATTGRQSCCYQLHSSSLESVSWSPNGVYIASASLDQTVHVWEATTGHEICQYRNHTDTVSDVAWAPDSTLLVSCSSDHTVQVWDAQTARPLRSLEGHTSRVRYVFFFNDGHLLASVDDIRIRVWRTDTWTLVEAISLNPDMDETYSSQLLGRCLTPPLLAVRYNNDIYIWELDAEQLMGLPGKSMDVQYTNAKVVLVGDSGVGKSGLGLVLSRQQFMPTESTHGRIVWTFAKRELRLEDARKEVREVLLWDLAGQPGYRLIHQLHLSEVAVALVVFDAHSESDPFAGIAHWVRALQTAQRVKGNASVLKKLLVLARMDRGGKRVSRGRIEELVQSQGFDGYFETSAKEGTNIVALVEAINQAIDWEMLPKVTSTQLFQKIKTFLLSEKQAGRLLSTVEDLERAFLRMEPFWGQEQEKAFSDQFVTCIGRVDAAGLIRRLSFGNLVLLQPEILDSYASALVNAVRDEPDGLGSILEEKVRTGDFFVPTDERIRDPEQEKLLLIAMVEDLLHYEIVLREQGEDGAYLVFPSESTRENPALPNPENISVVFTFEGPVSNIYASLAVRLSHSGLFTKKELWRNAITYTATAGGICGILLKSLEGGLGELTLFFDTIASEETCFYFEDYVSVHLQRKSLLDSLKRRRLFMCNGCGYRASDQLVSIRRERAFNWFDCPGCGYRVWLLDREERLNRASISRVSEMDRAADVQRERAKAQSKIQGKQEVQDFDVFLSYHSKDRESVVALGEQLKQEGLLPWLDVWELRPGLLWQDILEKQIAQIKSAAICIGKDGIGPWQQQEMAAFLREFVERKCPVIPLLLPDAPRKPRLPVFLKGFTWVDFRPPNPDSLRKLIWGITGEREF